MHAFFKVRLQKNDTKLWYQNSTIKLENTDNTEKNEELRRKTHKNLPKLRQKVSEEKSS